MRSEMEVNRAVDKYADMVQRICLCHLKNTSDTEDIFQEVYLKYMLYDKAFESEDHEKAWFIRVSINACRDRLRFLARHKTIPLDELPLDTVGMEMEEQEVLKAVLSLPSKYKDIIYLHYYEGYSAPEIGRLLHKKENTIYSLLSRGRTLLKGKLGGDEIEE